MLHGQQSGSDWQRAQVVQSAHPQVVVAAPAQPPVNEMLILQALLLQLILHMLFF